MVNKNTIRRFRRIVWNYYRAHGRHEMPWRKTHDPYKILVSEIMLQQTQVSRVLKFYPKFLKEFPNFHTLARAPLKKILSYWQGMGYNRRALALKKLAQEVMEKHGGKLPNTVETLEALPGIGTATAGAIMAYAFNIPVPYIETNIRRVFIHYFFTTNRHPRHDRGSRQKIDVLFGFLDSRVRGNDRLVSDKEILKFVEKTLDKKNPREWYWALMDYGSMLGMREKENPNTRSNRYRKQSKFEGSIRQVRGEIIKLLVTYPALTTLEMRHKMKRDHVMVKKILAKLVSENFIIYKKGKYRLNK